MYNINKNIRNFGLVALLAGSLIGAVSLGKNKFDRKELILPNSRYENTDSYLEYYKNLDLIRKGVEIVDIDKDGYKDFLVLGQVPSRLFYPDGVFSRIYFFRGHKDGGYYFPSKLLIDRIPILVPNIEISDFNNDGKKDIKLYGEGEGKGFDDKGFGSFTFINGKDFSL